MKVWEPKRAFCCSLRTGTLAGAFARIIIVLVFIGACAITLVFCSHPTQFIILMCLIGGALISLTFSSVLMQGLRKNNLRLLAVFQVLQIVETSAISILFVAWSVILGASRANGFFFLVLVLSIGSSASMIYFIFVVRAYYLHRKRLKDEVYEDGDERPEPPVTES